MKFSPDEQMISEIKKKKEASMPSEGIRIMENALQRYIPKNHTEQKVQRMILKKSMRSKSILT